MKAKTSVKSIERSGRETLEVQRVAILEATDCLAAQSAGLRLYYDACKLLGVVPLQPNERLRSYRERRCQNV